MQEEFWKGRSLDSLDDEEWEALCDGCGRCCLVRFENPAGDGVFYTLAACRLLDPLKARCSDYRKRFQRVSGCLSVRDLEPAQYRWLPQTCAYRVLAEGGELADWHPLVSGDPRSVAAAGISVAGRVVSEDHVHPDDLEQLVLRD